MKQATFSRKIEWKEEEFQNIFLDIKKGTFGNGQILGSKEVDTHVGNLRERRNQQMGMYI